VNAPGTDAKIAQNHGTDVRAFGSVLLSAPDGNLVVGNIVAGTWIGLNIGLIGTATVPTADTLSGKTITWNTTDKSGTSKLDAPQVFAMAGKGNITADVVGTDTGGSRVPIVLSDRVNEFYYAAPAEPVLKIHVDGPDKLKTATTNNLIVIDRVGGPKEIDFNGSSVAGRLASNVAGQVVGSVVSSVTDQVESSFRPGNIDQVILLDFQGDLSVPLPSMFTSVRGILLPPIGGSDLEDRRKPQ